MVPADRPIVTQISRFDPWKDPAGVMEAAHIAQREVDFTLVLLGNMADDDPEGARIFADLTAKRDARTMVLDAARRYDAGEKVVRQVACAKLFASEMVGRVADRAVQIHGGAGYMNEYAVERFYRDVRLFRIYEGTSQIQQIIIARDMLKD